MRKIVLTFGLIAGAVLSAMMLLALLFQDEIGLERGAVVGYTSMVLAFLMVFFGVKSYRDNVAGGRVTFGRAFTVGLMITAVASTCYVASWHRLLPARARFHGQVRGLCCGEDQAVRCHERGDRRADGVLSRKRRVEDVALAIPSTGA